MNRTSGDPSPNLGGALGVEQATKLELMIINIETAKTLGFTIPPAATCLVG